LSEYFPEIEKGKTLEDDLKDLASDDDQLRKQLLESSQELCESYAYNVRMIRILFTK